MKKISLILAVILSLLLGLTGCSAENVKIEGHEWELTLIQSNEDGSVIGCASEHYEMHKETEGIVVVDLVCSAADGSFTITDKTNNATYQGIYKVSDNGPESTIYEVNIGEETGNAVTAYTKYEDSSSNTSKTPTLIITIGDYTLNFQAE